MRITTLFCAVISFVCLGIVSAKAACSVTNHFTDGQVAAAGDVNTNFSDVINCLTPGQLYGTTTNDDAASGRVGEYIANQIYPGPSVASATPTDITTISLTPGDWDVSGCVEFQPGGGPTTIALKGWINTTSATPPPFGNPNMGGLVQMDFNPGNANPLSQLCTAPMRFRVAASTTTTVYLSGLAAFTGGTGFNLGGYIGARRMR